MQCSFCKGTGEECGCGLGYCDHCNGSGKVCDYPFDGKKIDPDKMIKNKKLINELADVFDYENMEELKSFVRMVALKSSGKVLDEFDVNLLALYWESSTRVENLGQWIQRTINQAERM